MAYDKTCKIMKMPKGDNGMSMGEMHSGEKIQGKKIMKSGSAKRIKPGSKVS